ncbi:hypothetical protein D3C75_980230 [compost metagenome]
MHHLVHDTFSQTADYFPLMLVQLGQLIEQTLHRFFMNRIRFILERPDHRSYPKRLEPQLELIHFLADHHFNLRSFTSAHFQIVLHNALQIVNIIQKNIRHICRRRINITWYSNINHKKRPRRAAFHSMRYLISRKHIPICSC